MNTNPITPKKTIVLFLFLVSSYNLLSWDSTAAKLYPLAIGNLWSYEFTPYGYPCVISNSYHYVVRIDSLVLKPNGKRYFKFSDGALRRIDSVTMNIYAYQLPNECLMDSLLARRNDTVRFCMNEKGTVYDTAGVNFAGSFRKAMHLRKFIIGSNYYTLASGLGLFYRIYCEGTGSSIRLNGCIINGVQYGNIIGVEKTSSNVPETYMLEQNYPNPFNPVTNIRFSIPKDEYTEITIFDITGKEIAVVLSELLEGGNYSVDFNAFNLASGVYFYKITAGEFIARKKMVLTK